MSLDCHLCFDVFGDVPTCVAGTISVIDGDRYVDLARLEAVLLDEASVNGAASATAIKETFGTQALRSGDGI